MDQIDEVVAVKSAHAMQEARRLKDGQGLFVGVSSGANMLAAQFIRQKYDYQVVELYDD